MWQFIKYLLATLLALTIFFVGGLLLVIGFASATKQTPSISDNSVLKLNLNKPITEVTYDDPLSELGLPFSSDKTALGLNDLKRAISEAKTNPKIKGIYLETSLVKIGFATLKELRESLVDFKKSGKFVVAYAEIYSEGAYYLASVADEVYLCPEGLVEFNGIGSQGMFYKGLLEKLEVKPEIFKVGKYKSAIEPFVLDKMSEANHAQLDTLLNGIYDNMLDDISLSRGIDVTKLALISDSMLVHNADDAVKYKLISAKIYPDEVKEIIRKKLKLKDKEQKISFLTYGDYVQTLSTPSKSGDKIAVIVATGEIRSGNSKERNMIHSDNFIAHIKKAKEDADVKAVVIRINSPGGSSLASDNMWREIVELRKTKPVIASMSDYAASGGYYMAMGCDKIVAQATTITGSIGVFGLFFNFQDLLKNKAGITVDGHYTGKFSDITSMTRPLTDYERKAIQKEVERTYDDFITKAAEGRKTEKSKIAHIAQGRVWTGTQALNNGLVDAIGGLETALQLAAKQAKVSKYEIKYLPEAKSYMEEVIESVGGKDTESKIIQSELGDLYPYFRNLQKVNQYRGIQSVLPFELVY